MKLFLLKRLGACDYDEAAAFVIRAKFEDHARVLAGGQAGDEGAEIWLYPDWSSCVELTCDGKSEIILRDFRAG